MRAWLRAVSAGSSLPFGVVIMRLGTPLDFRRGAMENIIEQVQQRADEMWKYFDSIDTGTPLGQETVPDDVWLAAFDAEERKYPPQLWRDKKTGATFMASAFTLALAMPGVDGGKELLARAERLRGQQ